jgi:hypothetical protein
MRAFRRGKHVRNKLPGIAGLVAGCALLGGCASSTPSAQQEGWKAPVYRVGSHLPAGREGNARAGMSDEERRVLDDMTRPRPAPSTGQ